MKRSVIAVMVLVGVAMQANAQQPSAGEQGTLLECFYECKDGPNVQGTPTYRQITTLMLTNQSPNDRVLDVYYFDGGAQCIAHSPVDLVSLDLDELNVCHTLLDAGVTVPQTGLVEILVEDTAGSPADGVYAWGKNVVGKFRTTNPEPFQGRVRGAAKFECRVVPAAVQADLAVAAACTSPPTADPVFVEGTACICNADLDGSGAVDTFDVGIMLGCIDEEPTGVCEDADLNCDGVINSADDTILTNTFGQAGGSCVGGGSP